MISGLVVIGRWDSQRRVELTEQHTAAVCRRHTGAAEGTCCEEMINSGKLMLLLSIFITLNLQKTNKENVRGQHREAQGEV